MVTIAPLALRNGFSAARANRKAAVRLTSITRCQSASESLPIGLRFMMPALETRPSSRPNVFTRFGDRAFDRGRVGDIAFDQERHASDFANARANPLFGRSNAATDQPSARRRLAMARPMPLAAPVTSAAGRARWAIRISASVRWRRRAARPIRSRSRHRGSSAACRARRARARGSRRSRRSRSWSRSACRDRRRLS